MINSNIILYLDNTKTFYSILNYSPVLLEQVEKFEKSMKLLDTKRLAGNINFRINIM